MVNITRRPNRPRSSRRRITLLSAALIGAVVAWVFLDWRLRPLVEQYSQTQAKLAASLAADRAVTQALSAAETPLTVRIQRDSAGNIQSVETDMTAVNRLKAAVTDAMTEALSQKELTLRIPLGTLLGSDLLTGRGPRLPIKVLCNATVITALSGRFESAGINQTNHQLWLTARVTMVCVISGFRQLTVESETQYLVAETVLVGAVPDTYADLGTLTQ